MNSPSEPTPLKPSPSKQSILVALAGNPNSGKTSIFNGLTGSRQHVANYPGVTVEKKSGKVNRGGLTIEIVDLPGIYSLATHSIEERIARQFLLTENPDVVVHVVDASNLDRNLYLTTQLLELGMNVILDLNMIDVAERKGTKIDREMLSERLGIEVVETVGNTGKGVERILPAVERNVGREVVPLTIDYGPEINAAAGALAETIRNRFPETPQFPYRWAAINLLEDDPEICKWVRSKHPNGETILEEAQRSAHKIESLLGDTTEGLITDGRYGFSTGLIRETVVYDSHVRRVEWSEKIDSVLLNRALGIPIFIAMMYLVFNLTFTIGEHPMEWIDRLFTWLAGVLGDHMAEGPIRSLIVDGIIGGVGGVITFLPNIILLFLAIALLEDSGYMARAAFLMDGLMHRIGLHGRSFIPMLTGFGCTVPGVLATRTLDSERDRLATIFVLPLMSCGARLPIYTLMTAAFIPVKWRGFTLFCIYFTGMILAVLLVKVLRVTVLSGESTPFVMELPPYRCPTLRAILHHMWNRSSIYIQKAGTIILGVSIILWALTTYPSRPPDKIPSGTQSTLQEETLHVQALESLDYSVAGRLGHGLSHVLKPLGFDWRISTALIGSFAAKEVFVAQLGIVFSLGEVKGSGEGLIETLRSSYTPLTGVCVMLFCLIATPCMATVAVVRRETNSWKWPIMQFVSLTALAYVLTLIVYQIGRALGFA